MRAAQTRITTVLRNPSWTRRTLCGSGPNLWMRPLSVV